VSPTQARRRQLARSSLAGDKAHSMRLNVNSGYALIVLVAAIWSANALIGRGTHEIIPPIGLTFWRFAVALPIFVALAWPHLRADIPKAIAAWPTMLALSVLGVSTYNSFIYIGLDHTTAINMVLINTARPVIIVLMSLAFFRVQVNGLQAVGLALGLVGTGVIVFRGDMERLFDLSLNIGNLWVLAATIAWAIYTVFLHKRPKLHPADFLHDPDFRSDPRHRAPRRDLPRIPRHRHCAAGSGNLAGKSRPFNLGGTVCPCNCRPMIVSNGNGADGT